MRSSTLTAALLLAACGGAEPEPSSPPPQAEEAVPEAAERAEPEGPAPADDSERARVFAEAEAFVRAQGYADAAPSVADDEIVHEGIEGSVEMRRNTLVPTPASGGPSGDGSWTVTFRYVDPQYAGRGRALVLRPGEPPRFVHQDMVFPQ